MAFSKRARLPIQKFLKRKAATRRARGFVVKQFPAEYSYSRVGVVVSRAVARKAAQRNRVRRIVLRAFADILPTLHVPSDILIIADPAASRFTYAEARSILAGLLIISSHEGHLRI